MLTKQAQVSSRRSIPTQRSFWLATKYAPKASFEKATDWLFDGMAAAFDANTARLAVVETILCSWLNKTPKRLDKQTKQYLRHHRHYVKGLPRFDINWNIIAWPGTRWAKRMFPDLSDDNAQKALADAIFAASRVDTPDPIAAWADHNTRLRERTDWLNCKNFAALHFVGEGTDLTVGLADGHEWMGGASQARNGVTCNPNIPSEEVFTTPHASKGEWSCQINKATLTSGNTDRKHIRDVQRRSYYSSERIQR